MHYALSFWFVCEFREFPKKKEISESYSFHTFESILMGKSEPITINSVSHEMAKVPRSYDT